MSLEIPRFRALLDADRIMVINEPGEVSPEVSFDMFSEVSVRRYNIANPKEENMYLRQTVDGPEYRRVETRLPTVEAQLRMDGLITHFGRVALHLIETSDNLYLSLVHHSESRIRRHATGL